MHFGRVLGSSAVQYGGRATAGGHVPWWGWVLLVGWSAVAVVMGIVLGRVIRTAEQREVGRRREDGDGQDEQGEGRSCAS